MKSKRSFVAVVLCFLFMASTVFFFSARWKKTGTEATINWDVSTYYLYLPATFIYHDIKQLSFRDTIWKMYHPTPELGCAFKDSASGNYVIKTSCGQAIMYLPFFSMAHLFALVSNYPADGYSLPYQFMISMSALIFSLFGLFMLRKILLLYFTDLTTAITIILISIGTNYFQQVTIDGALTHNYLFTLYCFLIWLTISFYRKPTYSKSICIGFLIALATLTRPTEIISFLIPLLWGFSFPLFSFIKSRFYFFRTHFKKLLVSFLLFILVTSIQLFYWKFVTGHWFYYSYKDEGFTWLNPHIYNGLLHYHNGWLIYSPVMVFSLIGFLFLYKKVNQIFIPAILFSALFIYITFSWHQWNYTGGPGIRAMIQCYPVLAFPLASFVAFIWKNIFPRIVFSLIGLLFLYFNIWMTFGGFPIETVNMTPAYFWKTVLRIHQDKNDLKLLDTEEEFSGERKNVRLLMEDGFENDSTAIDKLMKPISGNRSVILHANRLLSPEVFVEWKNKKADWVRATVNCATNWNEYDVDKMTRMYVQFFNGKEIVKQKMIRVQRLLKDFSMQQIYFDVRTPEKQFDKIGVYFSHAGNCLPIEIDDVKIESFDER